MLRGLKRGWVVYLIIVSLVLSILFSFTWTIAFSSSKITNKPVTLTVWSIPRVEVLATAKNLGETPFAKEMEKRTGVKVKFIHPPVGQEVEQFNLIIATGELPDIMVWNWRSDYVGGPTKAIQDGVIIELNDLFKKGYAPNLNTIYKQHPEWEKLAKTDDGKHYVFPLFRQDGNKILTVYIGLVVRKDWLDELKLLVPTTIDEWYTVLKAFKTKKGAKTPLSFQDTMLRQGNFFVGAYGIGIDFYLDKGKVKYGPAEPQFKNFLTTFNKWYKEGLLDPEWLSQDRKSLDSKVLSGYTGATLAYPDSMVGVYLANMKNKDPKFDLVGAPNPTLKKDQTPKFIQMDWPVTIQRNSGAAITSKCKDKVVACKWLDYWYSKEGQLLCNYGIEKESFTYVKGKPKFTSFITNNKYGWTFKQALVRYTASASGDYCGVQWVAPVMEQKVFKQQLEVVDAWAKGSADWRIPPLTLTTDESKKFASIMNDINTYRDEMYSRFVTGQAKLTTFDKYLQNIKRMGIDEAIKLYQQAYERFKKR